MRRGYGPEQAERDIEILTDCCTLCATSNNLETVIMRLELGLQKTYALLQAEQAGIIDTSLIRRKIEYFKAGEEQILIQALHRCYEHQMEKADQLKTKQGKINRLNKFVEETEKLILPKAIDKEDDIVFMEELLESWEEIVDDIRQGNE